MRSNTFLLALLLIATLTTGCRDAPRGSSLLDHARTGRLTVGVSFDQPGLGQKRADNSMRGFDIDVARFIAAELGVPEDKITWRQVFAPDREGVLEHHEADMIVATYSITTERKDRVTFAGPYFIAGQDLLVRFNDSRIIGPDQLDGHTLCSVEGTTSAQKIRAEHARNVRLVEFNRFEMCVQALLSSQVDAVTTDDLILAGYAAKNPELLRVVGNRFSEERYGVGLSHGDALGRASVNAALEKMFSTGAWRAAINRNFGMSDFVSGPPPTISER